MLRGSLTAAAAAAAAATYTVALCERRGDVLRETNIKSKSLTLIVFSELRLEVLGVDVDEILLFRTFAFPAAETAAA